MTRRAFGGLAVALGERMWAQEAPGGRAAASDYLAPSRVPPEARGVLAALGDRLARPGKERVIAVGASQATYVFRFDGANWIEEAKLEESCSQGRFGEAVALSGDRLVVGSPIIGCLQTSPKGHAFFYRHAGNGVWQFERRFGGDRHSVGNYYGWSVAIEGESAVVGSPHSARVNVYRHDGTNWVDDSVLSQSSSGFGWDVSYRDGRLVVGAPSDNTQQEGAGAAFVYRRSGTGWVTEGMLLPPPTSPAQKLTGSYYGTTVAISGDLLAMGGPQADATAQQDGGVLVFSMQNGSWTYRTTLTAAGAASYDYLGTGLDIDNGTVVAGAPGHDALGSNVGAAYLFTIPISDPNNQPPQPTFSAKRERLTVHLDASLSRGPDGTIVSYDWDFGDGNSGSGVNTSYTYSSSGTYTIRLTVTDNGGATASISLNLTDSDTNMLPKASFTATTNWLSVSLKASGSYDPDGQLVGYSWNFGDGNGGSGHSVSHTYAAAGTYTITLTVTDNEGGESSASQAVTVNDPPEISLTATGYKVRNLQKVDLVWSRATSAQVDVYFSSKLQSEFWGVLVATVPNTGTYTHHVDRTRGTTYKHWVCEAGTDKCSNKTEVVFY